MYIVWVVECSKWNLTAIDTEKRINNDWNMKLLMLAKTQVEVRKSRISYDKEYIQTLYYFWGLE